MLLGMIESYFDIIICKLIFFSLSLKPKCITINHITSHHNSFPKPQEGTRQRSALDKNPDAQALLDMIGKTRVSEGLREAEESD